MHQIALDYFSNEWKCAEVIMLLKPNKREYCTSSYHRPLNMMLSDVILPEHQFGFRRGHRTFKQCPQIVENITIAFEAEEDCAGVFFDVKHASDSMLHSGLLFKINQVRKF